MQRDTSSDRFPLGSVLPRFELLNVDGKTVDADYFNDAKASLVVFACNHCPYVKGSEEMLMSIVRRFQGQGLKTVAISSNDAAKYPEDSYEKMQEKAAQMDLPYPYLYDESQQVAKSFDAACTPELYLFDAARALVYHGTINDSPRDPTKVTRDYLSDAVVAVLAGRSPSHQFVHPIGCSIKWKDAF
jgi:peroxiredoxin